MWLVNSCGVAETTSQMGHRYFMCSSPAPMPDSALDRHSPPPCCGDEPPELLDDACSSADDADADADADCAAATAALLLLSRKPLLALPSTKPDSDNSPATLLRFRRNFLRSELASPLAL